MSHATTSEVINAPRPKLMSLIQGFMAARVVHVAAELGIADLLGDGKKTAEALAHQTETHPPALYRLLRALASLALLEEIEPGCFALTELGDQLRTGVSGSLRNFALMFGGDRSWRSWGNLLHSVRTGESATQHLYGMGSFEYLAAHPEQAVIFNEAMAEATRQVAGALVAAYDFSRFRAVADIGGGSGTLLAAILAATPNLHGMILDLPAGIAEAAHKLAVADVSDRCEVLAGDFFRAVPSGADAYILKSVIHDWDDERSITILLNCRKAISSDGKLLLVERVMPTRMEASPNNHRMAMLDTHMLVMPGGRERTEDEYRALLASARFELTHVLRLREGVGVSVIEAVPA